MNNKEKIFNITAVLLMIDQILKILVNHYMTLNKEITIIPKFFSLLYVKNTGAAFSILSNNTTLLIVLSVIFILFLNKYIIKEEKNLNKLSIVSLGMVMGGIFGNLIDRIIHHGVIDYLSFTIFNYDFAIFNFADICITLGVLILIIDIIKDKRNGEENGKHRKI